MANSDSEETKNLSQSVDIRKVNNTSIPLIAEGEAMSQDLGGSTLLPSVHRLRGEENFQQWKYDIENIARVHGLRKFYHPKASASPKVVDEFDEDASSEEIKAYDAWARGDSKMKLCITNNVSSTIAAQLNRLKTAKDMWETLANQYESSGTVLNQQAIAKYIKMDYKEYESMDDFILAFQKSVDMLNTLEISPPESWHPLVFLEAVKDSFPVWAERQRSVCRGRDNVTLSELIHDLKDEARADLKTSVNQMALLGNQKNAANSSGSGSHVKGNYRPKPFDCKICGNPKARHAKGKCFEYPKNKELLKQWEQKNGKKWRSFRDISKEIKDPGEKNKIIANNTDSPRFGGLTCLNMRGFVSKNSERWILDTGASSHIANSVDKFDCYKEVHNLPLIATANGPIRPRGLGTVTLQCKLSNGMNNPFELRDVLYLPECPINLFSGEKLLNVGGYIKDSKIYGPDGIEFATYDSSLHIVESIVTVAMPATLQDKNLTLDLWHRRLGHLSLRNIKETEKLTTGISYNEKNAPPKLSNICEPCELAKPLRHVRKSTNSRPRRPLDSISVDVVMINPIGKILINNFWTSVKYCTMFTDAATSARWGYFHHNKNEAGDAIQNFNALMKTQYDAVVKSWRLDGGKEYSPQNLGKIATKLGQIIETTTPYFPEQDGRAERSIGIIKSRVRTVSIEKNVPKFLWPELVRSQLQIANRTATSVLKGETPIQAFNRMIMGVDEKPNLSHLRVLGCKTYVQIPIEKRVISRKLEK